MFKAQIFNSTTTEIHPIQIVESPGKKDAGGLLEERHWGMMNEFVST